MASRRVKEINIGIIHREEATGRFLAAVIRGTPGMRSSLSCSTGSEALRLTAQNPPDVCLVGLFLPDSTGTNLVAQVQEIWPEIACILLVPEGKLSAQQGFEILEAGARGYLASTCPPEDLVDAIRSVSAGGTVLSKALQNLVIDYFQARGSATRQLTHREREVLHCLSRGMTQQEIGHFLGISPATVERHVHNLLPKLHAHCAAQGISTYLNPILER